MVGLDEYGKSRPQKVFDPLTVQNRYTDYERLLKNM